MSAIKAIAAAILLGLLLWVLYPKAHVRTAGVTEIQFMGPAGPVSGPLEDAIRVFEEQSRQEHAKDPSKPIYRVVSGQNASVDPTADPTRFIISLVGGVPPDVVNFDRFAVAEWAARNAFEPLDAYLERDLAAGQPDAIRKEDYYVPAWEEVVFRGADGAPSRTYGIPFDIDTRALFYNKDLLVRAGYVDAKGQARPPRTWEELEDMTARLTERNERGQMRRLGFAPNYGNSWLYIYGWLNGGEFMSPDGRTVTLNDPKIVEALTWMKRVYDKAGGAQEVYGFQSAFQGSALDPFLLGQVAMKIDRSYIVSATMAQYGRNMNWGVAPPPLPEAEIAKGRQSISWMGGWCFAIPSSAKQKEGAWALIRFLNSEPAQRIICESERLNMESQGRVYVPAQRANRKLNDYVFKTYVYDRPEMDSKVKAAVETFNELIDHARYRPVTPVGQVLWNQHIAAMENAIFGKMTPQVALDTANGIVQRQLDTVLRPPQGTPINWTRFFIAYGVILAASAVGIFLWDTRAGGAAGGKLDRSQWAGGWITAFPWLLGFVVFTGGPIFFSLVISFCEYDVLSPARFIGAGNYVSMMTDDVLFWKSFGNTLFMVIGVVLGLVLGLAIALLLNLKVHGVAVWRTFFYLPSIVPVVASSILWIWILNPSTGLLNSWLAVLGIHGPNWLQDENTSKISLIIMGLWTSGSGIVIWLAGLKSISETYYEAAVLDGANLWQQFRHVTLPMLSPYIFFNLVMGLIGTFQIFTQSFIMTRGGPVDSTLFYVYYLFNHAFRYLNMGYAAAMAWFLFLIVMGLTLVQMRLSKRWVHYEAD
jgi:ABC-type sugar transport system permease subunit/ABC-type glycerol-3-phosphate transport system substrate-binding protein